MPGVLVGCAKLEHPEVVNKYQNACEREVHGTESVAARAVNSDANADLDTAE